MRFTEDEQYLDESIPLQIRARWLLIDVDAIRIDIEGGYPAETSEVENHIVVATVNYKGAPTLEVYKKKHLIKWFVICRDLLIESGLEDDIVDIGLEIDIPVEQTAEEHENH